MNKFLRYTRRLIFWFERPLPKEEWMSAFRLGEQSMLAKMKDQAPANPFQRTQPAPVQQIQPMTIRQKAQMQKLRTQLQLIPHETEPSPVLPAVPFEFHLVDETWLNDTPVSVQDELSTEQVPAISKLLHGGN